MNKYLIIIVLFYLQSNAQTTTIQYSETPIISAEKLKKIPEHAREKIRKSNLYNLVYSKGISIYKAESIKETESENKKESEHRNEDLGTIEIKTEIFKSTTKKSERLFFKNYLKKEMFFIWPNGSENLLGKDSLQNWNWKITEETKKIEGFNCKKATSNWLGYDFTAWYTEDIGTSIGPERFDGLPGLILYVYTPYFEWKALKINQNEEETTIEQPNFNDKKTNTLSEINDLFTNKMRNNAPIKTTIQDGDSTITTEKIIIK